MRGFFESIYNERFLRFLRLYEIGFEILTFEILTFFETLFNLLFI